jgi:Tfp pilus assembly protein PilF
MKSRYPGRQQFVALLAATLWAVHPIQVQAVTYIVQRMASMAAMFYLLGIYCYLKARLNSLPANRGLLFAGCIVSYFLALGSKENSAMFPLALLLVEVVFFQDPNNPQTSKKLFWCAVGGVFFVVLSGALFFMKGQIFSFLKGYAARPFTLWERLLTEPRILVLYISQIFYPLPGRFSIGHDIAVSTSLFKPWTTLPAIFLISGFIAGSIRQIKQWPLAAFAVLFFFLNHLIESSIIPLELVFEHRNYLPSLFLFVPVASLIKKALDRCKGRKHPVYRVLAAATVALIVGLGISTHARNSVWRSDKTLWEDVMRKSSGLAGPYQVLAAWHNEKGESDISLQLYRKSLNLGSQMPKRSRALCLNNMGNIYSDRGEYRQAATLFKRALTIYPGHENSLYNITLAFIRSNQLTKALEYADLLNSKYYHAKYMNLKGFILIRQGRPDAAIPYLARALAISPLNRNATINLAVAFTLTGQYEQSELLLRKIHQIYLADMTALLYLIENNLRAGKNASADRYIERLFQSFSVGDIKAAIASYSSDNAEILYQPTFMPRAVGKKLYERASE